MDLEAYRAEAETFLSRLDREYLLHYSGRREAFEIEPIYEEHAGLFGREAVEALRESGSRALLEFAVQGLIGRATKAEDAELARREAALELTLPEGETIPFRQAAVEQANAPDPERRAALETARLELTERELNPLLLETMERTHVLARELGWPSLAALCRELSGIDLEALARQTEAFLEATEAGYEAVVAPLLERELGFGFERLRRSDLPALFRAPSLDPLFGAETLLSSLEETVGGLGLAGGAAEHVQIDAEQRPKKSPRAFCAPVRVPEEIHLVIPRIGGRDDYEALFHEAGHAWHYAHVRAGLRFEDRYLGDNSVTEGFAFLFQHLVSDPAWLHARLGVAEPAPVTAHARAVKLFFLRRYAAKLAYELRLHGGGPLDGLRAEYARRLSAATHVSWPEATWLGDVDPFFYAARYLRAWALETRLRRVLRERYGGEWFAQPEAGELLRSLWADGQRLTAEELLAQLGDGPLDFSGVMDEEDAAA